MAHNHHRLCAEPGSMVYCQDCDYAVDGDDLCTLVLEGHNAALLWAELAKARAEIERLRARPCAYDERDTCAVVADLEAAQAEIARLRAELTTTLVACERCGRGVPPKYEVLGLCSQCAKTRLMEALGLIGDLQDQCDQWHAKAEQLQAQIDAVLLAIHGGSG